MSIAPWLLLAAIAAGPDAGAEAAGGDAADGAALLDEVTVVASRLEQPLAEVPATVSTVGREAMDRTLVSGIADVVRYLPGIGVSEDATRFGTQGYSIRGLDGNRVAIELDDIPIADGYAVGSFSRAGRDVVDPALLESIEILRGPASTLYGSDALAGVVAYRTLDAEDFIARAEGDAWLGARAGVDSRDDSVALGASGAWAGGPWSALAWVGGRDGHERENNPRPGGLQANPADTSDRYGLLELAREWEQGGRWMLAADRSRYEQQTDVQSLVAGPGQYATTTALTADDSAERERLSLHGAVPLDAPGLERLRALAYHQATRTVQETDQVRRGATPSLPATRRERRFDYDTRTQGLELSLDGRYALGDSAHRYVAGVDLARTDIDETRDGSETNLATGITTPVILGERFPVRDFPPSVVDELGLYAQDEIGFGASPWSLVLGLRWDRTRVDAEPDATWSADNPGVPVVDLDDHQLTPRIAVRYAFHESGSAWLTYTEGFRAPPFTDVNLGLNIPAFNYVALPNPELQPERSKGLEAGLRWDDARDTLALAVWANRFHDLIESRVNLGVDPASGATVFQSQNRDRARIEGVDFSWARDFDPDAPGGFGATLALSVARGRDTGRDQPLNSVLPAQAVASVYWESPQQRHRLELFLSAADAKDDVDESRGPLFQPPGYGVLDAYWRWAPNGRVTLDVGARNLGDRRYWLWSGVRGFAPTAPEVDLYTQPGRSLAIALAVGW